MIVIDGSSGEGGGQILRTSLALSLVTSRPFEMTRIRAARSRPGLQRQHLAAVLAAAKVGKADVRGAALHSQQLVFAPQGIHAGEYHFRIGTAGSVSLVLQTILPALALARGPSRILVEGGTHNHLAPPFEFLQQAYLPLMARMGPRVEATLERHGFYPLPEGGGSASRVCPKTPGSRWSSSSAAGWSVAAFGPSSRGFPSISPRGRSKRRWANSSGLPSAA